MEQKMDKTIDLNLTTMTSSELAELLGKAKKHINEKIKKLFPKEIEGRIIRPSLNPNGTVVEYHLPEIECKMFVAKYDMGYLRLITEFWVQKGNLPTNHITYEEAESAAQSKSYGENLIADVQITIKGAQLVIDQ